MVARTLLRVVLKVHFLSCFIYQSLPDTADALQGLVVDIHLTGFLCLCCWLGDELSTRVLQLTNLCSKTFLMFIQINRKMAHSCLIECVVTEDSSNVSVCFTCCTVLNTPHVKCFNWHIT